MDQRMLVGASPDQSRYILRDPRNEDDEIVRISGDELLPEIALSRSQQRAWSPDSTRVAYAVGHRRPDDLNSTLEVIYLDRTPIFVTVYEMARDISSLLWSRDGRPLLLLTSNQTVFVFQIVYDSMFPLFELPPPTQSLQFVEWLGE